MSGPISIVPAQPTQAAWSTIHQRRQPLAMTRTELSRTIDAPVGVVFSTIADISNFSKAVPHILDVEFLS